ncbi:MAG: acyltransferase [Acidobacteriota bacterium]|nr:acyltransferase [Acidobacteriota bacterium]
MRIIRILTGICGGGLLIASLLAINLLQMASLVMLPFSRKRFRAFNRACADTWWGWCVIYVERFQGIHVVLTGDALPRVENAIVVANHRAYSDILMLLCLGARKGRLGDMKWFVKDVLKYLPGVGWGMLFLDCIFVKRDWTADRASIEKVFAKVKRNNISIWLMSFLEGTRLTPRKLVSSQRYMASLNLAPTSFVMVPRTKGFVASVRGLGSHLQAIYDVTIAHEGPVLKLWELVKGNPRNVHLHVRRFSVQELPLKDSALAEWAIQLFAEKEKLLEQFQESGAFPQGVRL